MTFVKNKFVRLLIPYFSIAIIYVIPIRLLTKYSGYQNKSYIELIVQNVVLGKDIGHLWFLPTLFLIFILFYLFEKHIRKLPSTLGIWFFISLSIISGFMPTIFFIQRALSYSLYFYIGYKVRELVQKRENIGNKTILVGLFILQFIGFGFSIITRNQNLIIFNGLDLLFDKLASLSSVLFYYLLFNKLSTKKAALTENKIIKLIDKESFQIYLFHSPLIYIVLYNIQNYKITPFLVVTGNVLICVFGSIFISKLVEYMNVFNVLIGKKQTLGLKKLIYKA